jgi:beta-barrel assembly-enhancing protease
MTNLTAKCIYRLGNSTETIEARAELKQERFSIFYTDDLIREFNLSEIYSLDVVQRETLIVNFGEYPFSELRINHPGFIHQFFNQYANHAVVTRYQKKNNKRWMTSYLTLFVGIVLLIPLTYFLLMPVLANTLANRIPPETEQSIGKQIYEAVLSSEKSDADKGILLEEFMKQMVSNQPYDVKVALIESDVVNAFALPGGYMVVYSGLLEKMNNYEELAALLSHEYIHIRNRHSLRSLINGVGGSILLSILFGDAAGILVSQFNELKNLSYSRNLETEADLEGMDIMIRAKVNPAGMIQLLSILKEEGEEHSMPEFLTTHPLTENRINSVEEKIKSLPKASFEKHQQLDSLFTLLRNSNNIIE